MWQVIQVCTQDTLEERLWQEGETMVRRKIEGGTWHRRISGEDYGTVPGTLACGGDEDGGASVSVAVKRALVCQGRDFVRTSERF